MVAEKPMVLIVEDDLDTLEVFLLGLSDQFEVKQATTLSDADRLFEAYQDCLFAIALDGNVGADTSIDLASKIINGGYRGYVVATSNNDDLQRKLAAMGCLSCKKPDLPDLLDQLLNKRRSG